MEISAPQIVLDKAAQSPVRHANIDYCLQGFIQGMQPPKDLTISQWAEENRILAGEASASKGKWTNERTPYLVEIMDKLSPQDPCSDVAFMKGSQIGGTECLINTALYYIKHSPCPIGLYQTTDDAANEFERQRLAPTFAAMHLDEYFSNDTAGCKEFPGGIFFLGSGGSASDLRSKPLQVVLCDEISGWVKDCNGEGDPCDLVKRRTTNFPRKKRFWNSTPTVRGECRITEKYEMGDQREYFIPCPKCGCLHTWQWSGFVWDKDENGNHLPYTVRYRCPHCGEEYQEFHKTELLAAGEWRATNPNGAYPSFYLPAFYSPLGWYSWEEVVIDFLSAQGDVQKMKVWTNNVEGKPWDTENESSRDYSFLELRKEKYEAEVPSGVIVLTAGIDTQDDRLEVEVVGWGKGLESWSIGYWIIPGDPDRDEVWEDLDEILNAEYKKADGTPYYIAAGLVDSGGHKTSSVYKYCAKREWRRIYAGMGARTSAANKPIIGRPKQTTKSRMDNASIVEIGTEIIKDWFFNVLSYEEPGVGYCHFPDKPEYDHEHFEQLTGEVKKKHMSRGYVVWHWEKRRERNEALDCRVYARAAVNLVGIDVEKYAQAGRSYTKRPVAYVPVQRQRRLVSGGVKL